MAPWKLAAAVSAVAVCLHTTCARRAGEEEVAELATVVHNNSTGLRFPWLSSSSGWSVTNPVPQTKRDWPKQDDIAKMYRENVFVFLEIFRMTYTRWIWGGLYHSHLLVCSESAFNETERDDLRKLSLEPNGFAELPEHWWNQTTAMCEVMSYRIGDKTAPCSGVFYWKQPLKKRDARMWNALPETVKKYYYGTGNLSALGARWRICDPSCEENWAGSDYNLRVHNCNTFAISVLHCVYGLSQETKGIGISNWARANCKC